MLTDMETHLGAIWETHLQERKKSCKMVEKDLTAKKLYTFICIHIMYAVKVTKGYVFIVSEKGQGMNG